MKIATPTVVLGLLVGLAATNMAYASGNGADNEFKGGKPFEELAAEVDANSTATAEGEAAAAQLEAELTALSESVASLTFTVSQNTATVTMLTADLDAAEAGLDGLLSARDVAQSELDARQADATANGTAIADLEAELAVLDADTEAALVAMGQDVNALRLAVEQEEADLDGLTSYVNAVYADAQLAMSDIQGNLAQIEADIAVAETLVEQAQFSKQRLDELGNLINANASLTASRQELEDLRTEYETHRHTFSDRIDRFEAYTRYYYVRNDYWDTHLAFCHWTFFHGYHCHYWSHWHEHYELRYTTEYRQYEEYLSVQTGLPL
jgi:chromosome segregation ATPase